MGSLRCQDLIGHWELCVVILQYILIKFMSAVYINRIHICLLVCRIMKTYRKTIYEYDLGQCGYKHFE